MALVHDLPMPWLTWLVYLFIASSSGKRVRALDIVLPIYVLCITLLSLPIGSGHEDFRMLLSITYTVVGVGVIAGIFWMLSDSWNGSLKVIAAALFLCAPGAANDLALEAHAISPEHFFVLPYCGLILFGSFLFGVQRRYIGSLNDYEHLSADLGRRLAAREAELNQHHLRLLDLERDHTLSTERQRLMRDMHDVLGSTLIASLKLVERGVVEPAVIAEMLRECIDDLQTVINSLDTADSDLVTFLATLRFRIGQKLSAAGVTLEWHMQDLPPLQWLGAPEALHVMRIVQEAVSNVIKHAHASEAQFKAEVVGNQIELTIADNGTGFDTSIRSHGRGLRFMVQRAEMIGGQIRIESVPGYGSTLTLTLPINKQMTLAAAVEQQATN